jgi:2-phosphosulfolactate phosphatase
VLAGEDGGRRLEGFDLGNSPTEVAAVDLAGATVVHRTSAGTQGLVRCLGSRWLFAASFVNVAATVAAVRATGTAHVTFVVTGASLGRDGDEDLACAELLATRLHGRDPDPRPFLDRVASSDAGRMFGPGGPDWAPASDLAAACELDRFTHALVATPTREGRAVEVAQR